MSDGIRDFGGESWSRSKSTEPSAAPEGAPREGIPLIDRLKDSAFVHMNILRGDITLSKAQAIHIAGLPADIEDQLRVLTEERHQQDKALDQTIAERDEAEEYIGDIYAEVTGQTAEWSNLFGFDDAFNDIAAEVKSVTEERDALKTTLEARLLQCETGFESEARRAERLTEERDQAREALDGLLCEYDDRKSQFGHDSIWTKYEDIEAVDKARYLRAAPVSPSQPRGATVEGGEECAK